MATRITISLPEELEEEITSRLEYGDSRSEWVRKAIELRLQQEKEEGNGQTAVTASAN